jgi:hypothetical protein
MKRLKNKNDLSELNILVVGTISNAEKMMIKDFKKLSKSLNFTNKISYLLIESDSQDDTVNSLQELKNINDNFEYISLGNLKHNIPNRINRIRYCRNKYVDYIRENFANSKWDIVIVVDLDGMNRAISKKKILSSLKKEMDWDIVTSNQKFGYYDLLALRAAGWVENDIFGTLKLRRLNLSVPKYSGGKYLKFIKYFNYYDNFRKELIYSNMIRIGKKSPWIPVKSSFGGLAIYNPNVFKYFNYGEEFDLIPIQSEHVDLHLKCNENGFIHYINPYMINSNLNQYNLNRIKLIRFLREVKKEFFTR